MTEESESKGFDPVEGFSTFRDNLRKAVDASVRSVTNSLYPPVDVYQEEAFIVVETIPLDGLDGTSIGVTMEGNILTISGTTRPQKTIPTEAFIRRERDYGSFSRSIPITIAVEAEQAKAKVKSGILTIKFPIKPTDDEDVIDVQVTS